MFLSGLEKGRIFYFLCFQTLEAGAGAQLRLEKAGQTAKKGKNATKPIFLKTDPSLSDNSEQLFCFTLPNMHW